MSSKKVIRIDNNIRCRLVTHYFMMSGGVSAIIFEVATLPDW
jgi:hypothetical protein